MAAVAVAMLCAVVVVGAVLAAHHGRRGDPPHPVSTAATASASPTTSATSTRSTATAPPPLQPARLDVAHGRGRAVPPGFFGLSFEYWGLARDERDGATFARLVALLHPRGSGPMTIRIGGDSSQRTLPFPRSGHLPGWAYGIDARWLRRTANLAATDHLKVIFDLNQITGDPSQEATLARVLLGHMPRHAVAGFELGNEPDFYRPLDWARRVADDPALADRLPPRFTPARYDADYAADARALAGVDPRVALLGPALGAPARHLSWITVLLAARHRRLRAVTVHEYPYSACRRYQAGDLATLPRLLSAWATDRMYAATIGAVKLTRRAHLPLRITEFNSVTCGGQPGVSDSFATALWAPGALFEMLAAGARSADLHARALADNSPFVLGAGGLQPRPLLYGLLLFARALGPGAQLLPARLHASGQDASAWVIRLRSGAEHVVVVDRGARGLAVRLRVRRGERVTVTRLLAPGASAAGDVTLGGQQLDAQARWVGRRVATTVRSRRGHSIVTVPATSAALVTITR